MCGKGDYWGINEKQKDEREGLSFRVGTSKNKILIIELKKFVPLCQHKLHTKVTTTL